MQETPVTDWMSLLVQIMWISSKPYIPEQKEETRSCPLARLLPKAPVILARCQTQVTPFLNDWAWALSEAIPRWSSWPSNYWESCSEQEASSSYLTLDPCVSAPFPFTAGQHVLQQPHRSVPAAVTTLLCTMGMGNIIWGHGQKTVFKNLQFS